jgi:hypothetical protein
MEHPTERTAYTVNPAYGKLAREYDLLYEAGAGRGSRAATYDGPALVAICEELRAIAPNDYAAAMGERRAYLHSRGKHSKVYDGADALEWKRAMENPKVRRGGSSESLAKARAARSIPAGSGRNPEPQRQNGGQLHREGLESSTKKLMATTRRTSTHKKEQSA